MSQATPLAVNNGIYLQTKEYTHGSHLDTAHLMNLRAGTEPSTDLGIITPWITTGYLMRPGMYEITGYGKNRILVDDHIWMWKTPIADGDTYIVEVLSEGEKLGADGIPFKFKLNKRKFANTDIITTDKYSQLAIYVTADEILQDGDGWIYTGKLHTSNAKQKWFPRELMRTGMKVFKIGSVMGEYSQTYSDPGEFSVGERTFYNYVGEGYANSHMTVTRDAAVSKISKRCVLNIAQHRKVIEMYQFQPGSKGADLSLQGRQSFDELKKAYGSAEAMAKDIVHTSWVPEVEALMMAQVESDVENYAMWGPGGTLDVEGMTKVRLPLGMYHQLNNGNLYTFNIGTLTKEKFEVIIGNLLKDRIEPYQGNLIVIGTGQGGMQLVHRFLRGLPQQYGMQWYAEPYIQGKDNFNLGFRTPHFVEWDFAFGRVRFELMPSLDPTQASEHENPMINGFRLSGYSFILTDISGQGDNIYEVVYGPDWDFKRRYINGRMSYLDSPNYGGPFASANNGPGYEVYIEKRMKAYWIKDPSKVLLLKPVNPKTGRPFGEAYFT